MQLECSDKFSPSLFFKLQTAPHQEAETKNTATETDRLRDTELLLLWLEEKLPFRWRGGEERLTARSILCFRELMESKKSL